MNQTLTDIEIGEDIAKEHGKSLSLSHFVLLFSNRLDWDRFDHETGIENCVLAAIRGAYGYQKAGGNLDMMESE